MTAEAAGEVEPYERSAGGEEGPAAERLHSKVNLPENFKRKKDDWYDQEVIKKGPSESSASCFT